MPNGVKVTENDVKCTVHCYSRVSLNMTEKSGVKTMTWLLEKVCWEI